MKTISTAALLMDRTTKGAVLYKNKKEGDGQAVTSLYLRKSALTEPYPAEIQVTVAVDEEGA